MNRHYFNIGNHLVEIIFSGNNDTIALLPSFEPFACDEGGETLFSLTVADEMQPSVERKHIHTFDTGNGDIIVFATAEGGHEFLIKDVFGKECCLLRADKDFHQCQCVLYGMEAMRAFGLNDAMMVLYAIAGCTCQTLLIHASCVGCDGKAYPFIAKSGTGKSTHSQLWMKHIEGSELINDDNPILRVIDGKPILFGSPWSGKTPCYRNVSLPLGAVVRIDRAPVNSIERIRPALAFASLLPACSSIKWDAERYRVLCDTVSHIVETTPIFTLHCLPDREAAILCHSTVK